MIILRFLSWESWDMNVLVTKIREIGEGEGLFWDLEKG